MKIHICQLLSWAGGKGDSQFIKRFLPGITWNIQIYKEKFMFANYQKFMG